MQESKGFAVLLEEKIYAPMLLFTILVVEGQTSIQVGFVWDKVWTYAQK